MLDRFLDLDIGESGVPESAGEVSGDSRGESLKALGEWGGEINGFSSTEMIAALAAAS